MSTIKTLYELTLSRFYLNVNNIYPENELNNSMDLNEKGPLIQKVTYRIQKPFIAVLIKLYRLIRPLSKTPTH